MTDLRDIVDRCRQHIAGLGADLSTIKAREATSAQRDAAADRAYDHLRGIDSILTAALAASPLPEPGLREALVRGQKDAEREWRSAPTRSAVEAYHHGRMVAYMDAIEAFDAALAASPLPEPGLDALRALSDAATPGPWSAEHDSAWKTDDVVDSSGKSVIGDEYDMERAGPNAALIVAAVNYVRSRRSENTASPEAEK